MQRDASIRIGISGWRYTPWRGTFYPGGLPQRLELHYAAQRFPTIEINGSFYSLQRPEYYDRWHDETPDDFVFSVKGSRYITHMLRLRGVETALANFFASGIARLRRKLGPILWQFPPNFRYDAMRLANFFDLLPRDTDDAQIVARRHDARVRGRAALTFPSPQRLRHAIEVRHPSFFDPAFVALLRRHRIGFVVADTANTWLYAEDVTADFVYIRLHGDKELYVSGYTEPALARWSERVAAWAAGSERPDATRISPKPAPPRRSRDVYCYFDNDIKVMAPRDARRLAELVRQKRSSASSLEPRPADISS